MHWDEIEEGVASYWEDLAHRLWIAETQSAGAPAAHRQMTWRRRSFRLTGFRRSSGRSCGS